MLQIYIAHFLYNIFCFHLVFLPFSVKVSVILCAFASIHIVLQQVARYLVVSLYNYNFKSSLTSKLSLVKRTAICNKSIFVL